MADKKTVLIIEDEQALLDSYAEALSDSGFNVIKASDGQKGLTMAKENAGKIDLILLDLMMPGIDGLEVLRTIKNDRESYGDSPIVILTNMTSDKVVKESFDLDAVSYLVKNELGYEELVKEVKKVLE